MSTYDLSKLIDQVIPDDDVSEGKELLEALKPAGKPPSNYDRERLLELLEEADRRDKYGGLRKWFRPGTPYGIDKLPKHKAFFDAGAVHNERFFCAGNRVGKSVAGAYETACHLTGLYPDWWEGRRFDHPINAWACGKTGKVTRDTVQKELLGAGEMGMGMIPKNLIHKMWAKPGTAKAVDILQVVHTSGGISSLTFKSYEEKVTSFYGDARHVVWMDEEADEYIYSECFLRTSQLSDCPEGGIIYTTFTPKQGITPFVLSFLKDCEYLADSPRVMLTEEELAESE